MGVLGAAAGRESTSEPVVDDVEPAVGESADQQQDAAPERSRAEDGTFVPSSALKPQSQGSRRNKTQEQIDQTFDARMKAYEEKQNQERQTWQQQMQEERNERQRLAQEHARLQGALEEIRRQPAAQAQQQGPDPEKLFAEAEAALEAGNIRAYQQKMREGMRAEAQREATKLADERIATFRQEHQRTQPAQVPPHIQSMLYAHQHVARAGERGMQIVLHKDQGLALYGHPPGPQRQQKAFELAEAELAAAGKQQAGGRPTGFSSDAAAALGGVTGGSRAAAGGGGGQEDGVQLNGLQESTWRRAGFSSAAEYVKWSDPHKHGLVK